MSYTVRCFDRLLSFEDANAPLALVTKKTAVRRGVVKGLSSSSRFRLVKLLATIGRKDAFLFVTLTYREFVDDFTVWKDHLDTWAKRLYRRSAGACGLWRCEFQERGAPHFHLLLWGVMETVESFDRWAREAWLEIIGQQSLANRRHGVFVVESDDLRTTGFYLSLYAAKDQKDRKDLRTGREWGVWRKPLLDVGPLKTFVLSATQALFLRRLLRRSYESRRKVSTSQSAYGVRLLRGSSFSTFLPAEESLRLVEFVRREADAVRSMFGALGVLTPEEKLSASRWKREGSGCSGNLVHLTA